MLRAFVTLAFCALATVARGQTPPPLVYGGDDHFPPYEYLDERGQPAGFNIELVRALAQRAGRPLEIRLRPWAESVAAFDRGEVHLMSLAHSDERAARYRLLVQTWMLRQSVVFRPGRDSYPSWLDQLANEVVALENRSVVHDFLAGLPELQRPAFVIVPNQFAAVQAVLEERATAAAGNGLTMRYAAAELGADAELVEIPVKTVAYYLAAARGQEDAMRPIVDAFAILQQSGEVARLVETNIVPPRTNAAADRLVRWLIAAGAIVIGLFAGGLTWARVLRTQVQARTAALERSESQYRQLVENASDLIYRTDGNGRFVFANPVAVRVTGYSEEELLGMPYTDLVEPGWREKVAGFYLEAARHKDASYFEFPMRTKSGHTVWVGQHVQPVTAGKKLVAFQGVARDITTRIAIDQLRSQFVSMVSHELRTPLTSIRASLQLLTTPGAITEPSERDDLERVALGNSERLIRIVNDILDMSKIEAGQLVIEPRPIEVRAIVEESVEAVRAIARDANVGLDLSIPEGLPLVTVDYGRTVQVLVNLLSNAIKHSPAGSQVNVWASPGASAVSVTVTDHGPGIPGNRLHDIFRPFTQLDSSDTRRIAGTGLGLTIAKALAELQGGTIGVVSEPGHGASFSVTLPL